MDEVSRALRPFLEQVWVDREQLLRRVASEVIRKIPSYTATPSTEVWVGMTRILERIVAGDPFAPPTEEDRQAAAGTGVQGGRAGIAVEDLVAAVLLGARVVEAEVMDRAAEGGVPAEIRLNGTQRARKWVEQVVVWAAQGLTVTLTSNDLDHVLATDLLAALRGRSGPAEISVLLTRLGFDPGGRHYVVIARAPRHVAAFEEVEGVRLRFAQADRAAWVREGDCLVGLLSGQPREAGELVLGVAGPASADELALALLDADRACRTAARLTGTGQHTLESLGLLLPLHEDARLRGRLIHRWLEPLRAEPRHDLLGTLRLWQQHGQVDAVARKLTVHPNTVRNRMARIDRLLPGWRTPQAQAEIWAALVVETAQEVADL